MILFSRGSDRTGERVWHVALPCLIASAGRVGAGLTLGVNPIVATCGFCVPGFGISAVLLEPADGVDGAGGGGGRDRGDQLDRDYSGYVAPQRVGVPRDATASYEIPMVAASLFMLAAAVYILLPPRVAARPILARVTARR